MIITTMIHAVILNCNKQELKDKTSRRTQTHSRPLAIIIVNRRKVEIF